MALLDGETSFPAGPFDSEDALAALTRLGMKASIGPESILQSAQYIAELGLQNPDLAHERYRASALSPFLQVVHLNMSRPFACANVSSEALHMALQSTEKVMSGLYRRIDKDRTMESAGACDCYTAWR